MIEIYFSILSLEFLEIRHYTTYFSCFDRVEKLIIGIILLLYVLLSFRITKVVEFIV